MQFAEVASGGAPLHFDAMASAMDVLVESPSESQEAAEGHNGMTTNEGADKTESNGCQDGDAADGAAAGAGDEEAATSANSSPGGPANKAAPKPDPVFEIAADLQVKIADLGNACWVVRPHYYIVNDILNILHQKGL